MFLFSVPASMNNTFISGILSSVTHLGCRVRRPTTWNRTGVSPKMLGKVKCPIKSFLRTFKSGHCIRTGAFPQTVLSNGVMILTIH